MTVKILVPVSGGKDSQACLKMAVENHGADVVRGLFCDTGWEHPKTYEHIHYLGETYGVQIDRLSAGTVEKQVIRRGRFPSPRIRFCTSMLKIRPSKRYYKALAESQGKGFEVWYGMRVAESSARKKRYADKATDDVYLPHEVITEYPKYLGKMGVVFRLPVLDWLESQVLEFLEGKENQLYRDGFDRVGCFPCLASGKQSIANAFNYDDFGKSQREKVEALEQNIGVKHAVADTEQLCMFCQI